MSSRIASRHRPATSPNWNDARATFPLPLTGSPSQTLPLIMLAPTISTIGTPAFQTMRCCFQSKLATHEHISATAAAGERLRAWALLSMMYARERSTVEYDPKPPEKGSFKLQHRRSFLKKRATGRKRGNSSKERETNLWTNMPECREKDGNSALLMSTLMMVAAAPLPGGGATLSRSLITGTLATM